MEDGNDDGMEEQPRGQAEAKPSRWESSEAFGERRRTMFGTPDATEHARARGPREREDPDSGNGRPRQAPRTDMEGPMEAMMEMFMQMQRMHAETIQALRESQHVKRDSLSKRIKDLPYKGRKWQANGELDMAVQLAEFIPDVERHARRSWRINPNDTEADKHEEVLKAVEESIGKIPKRAWYDAWVRQVEQQRVVPSWPLFKSNAEERFLKGEQYKLKRIMALLGSASMGNKDPFQFNSEFRTKMARLPENVTLEDIIKAKYLLELHPETMKTLLLLQEDKSLDQWMQTVEDMVKRKPAASQEKGKTGKASMKAPAASKGSSTVHCYKCGAAHLANKCSASEERVAEHQAKCDICKKRKASLSSA